MSGSELIAGLPKRTFNGHSNDNKASMDLGANIYNYNLRLLFGTEITLRKAALSTSKAAGLTPVRSDI